ncbi:GNAT family N-acetyltransferase [Herbiconiux daphne]|uniref:GNAT family N-acetyltransferase n=1 Tax=Herbiconiux daphne TaxID=2970914 RepID=A0ABT2H564_9MICO|nr:GNAT family N-acetyltransferase [Herbiconiux daphne]MCS5735077.1 GNAT family N-acetyltransferase [Herbiconiux daphne]
MNENEIALYSGIPGIPGLLEQLANIRAYWLGWGIDRSEDDSLTYYRSGINHPRLNAVLRTEGLDLISQFGRARSALQGVPWLWDLNVDSAPETEAALLQLGAIHAGSMPIMARELGSLTYREPRVPGLVLTETNASDLDRHVIAYSTSMGVAPSEVDRTLAVERARTYAGLPFHRFHAQVDGAIVGTAETLVTGDIAGLFLVSTVADRRREGIASSLSTYALERSKEHGARTAVLQASGSGEPVYRRLGFMTVGTTTSFVVGEETTPS